MAEPHKLVVLEGHHSTLASDPSLPDYLTANEHNSTPTPDQPRLDYLAESEDESEAQSPALGGTDEQEANQAILTHCLLTHANTDEVQSLPAPRGEPNSLTRLSAGPVIISKSRAV